MTKGTIRTVLNHNVVESFDLLWRYRLVKKIKALFDEESYYKKSTVIGDLVSRLPISYKHSNINIVITVELSKEEKPNDTI
jgi:hypothetical protein